MSKELEFTKQQEERIDDVYNAVYDCMLTVLDKTPEEFPWDMEYIGQCTDVLISALFLTGATNKIYFPSIVDDNGNEHIEDYEIFNPNAEPNIEINNI